jgi:hypothetical protein
MRVWTLRIGLPLLAALAVWHVGATFAAFNGTASPPASSFSGNPDWTPPTAGRAVVQKTQGGNGGYIKQGGTFWVYANVTDAGNPAGGVSTVTAATNSFSTTANPTLSSTGGPWTVDGLSYNYRSGSLTALAALTNGSSPAFTVTSTDVGGASQTDSGFSVTADNSALAGTDVQTQNKAGGTAGRAELGDKLIYTHGEQMDPYSILAGWNGTSQNVVVRLLDGGGGNDTLQVWNSTNGTQLALGSVSLANKNYNTTGSTITFGATGTASTIVQSGNTVTVTLGTQSAAPATVATNTTMVWTPSATATDRAGSAMPTTAVNESGTADKNF